jgi:CheY-like chemotaxis protein
MALEKGTAAQLPYLRRLARALTGSQESGDRFALAALEATIAYPMPPNKGWSERVWLYRALLKIWLSVANPPARPSVALDDETDIEAAERNLEAISPLPRAAFLLQWVEGFSAAEIAAALDRPVAEVAPLIQAAGREIASQITTDILIIEDEPIISMDLEALVTDLGHRVTAIARTHIEAIEAVGNKFPGLVLADIHLADASSGIDAVNEILAGRDIPVVFITAFPEQLLTGLRPEPTFLITKPFRTETVRAAISQALFFGLKAHRSLAAQHAEGQALGQTRH